MRQIFLNACIYAKQKINLTWLNKLFLFFSSNRSCRNLSIFLTWLKLFGTECTSQIASWSFYFLKWVFAQNASLDGRSHLNWSSFDTLWTFLVSRPSSSFSELEEWEDNEVEDELKDRELRLFVVLLTSLFLSR